MPPIIPKEERKKNPDKAEFDKQIEELNAKIEGIRAKMRNTMQKKKEAAEGGRVQGSQLTFKDFLREKIDELKVVRD